VQGRGPHENAEGTLLSHSIAPSLQYNDQTNICAHSLIWNKVTSCGKAEKPKNQHDGSTLLWRVDAVYYDRQTASHQVRMLDFV
jgi:hypothetical protein